MAKVKIGSLYIALSASTARISKDFIKANGIVGKFKRKTIKAMKSVAKSVFSFKGVVVGLAGAAGLGLMIKASLSAIDTIGKMSKTYGIATEELAAFELAASIGGSTLQVFAKAARQVAKNTFDYVVRGTGEAKDAFEALGITTDRLRPIMNDNVALIGIIGDELNKMEDGAIKTALAYKLLGGRAIELLPALEGGSEQFQKYREEAKLFGTALSSDAVKGVEDTNDSITRLGFLFKGLRDQTVSSLAPAIQSGVDAFRNWVLAIAKSEGGIKQFSKNIAISVLHGVESMIIGFQTVIGWLGQLKDKLEEYGILEKKINVDSIQGQKRLISSIDESLARATQSHTLESDRKMMTDARAAAVERLAYLESTSGSNELDLLEKLKVKNRELIAAIKAKNAVQSGGDGGGDGGIAGGSVAPIIPVVGLTEKSTQLSNQVESIRKSLRTEEQSIMESYTRRSVIVSNAFVQKLISQEARDELLRGLAAKHEDDKTKIAKNGEAARRSVLTAGLGAASNIFSSLSSLMGKEGKKQNATQKLLARAGIVSSTAQAIMLALHATPSYLTNLGLAAGAALQGAKQLRVVGGGGGGVSAPVSSPVNQDQQSLPIPQQPLPSSNNVQDIRITVDWENGTPDQIDQLAVSLAKNMANGGNSPVAA